MKKVVVALGAILLLVAACADDPPMSSATGFAVTGYAHAGPVCPVATDPPTPECEDRPVADARLIAEDVTGTAIASTTTEGDGSFRLVLAPGVYRLVPQTVEGLMGTAPPQDLVVVDTPVTGVDLAYDTGIR